MNDLINYVTDVPLTSFLQSIAIIAILIGGIVGVTIKIYKVMEKWRTVANQNEEKDEMLERNRRDIEEIKKQIAENNTIMNNKINQLISFNEESKHRELLRLRHDIVETCNKAIKAGIVKNSQLLSIEELYETYKGLGGNHYVATLIERVETLDIDFDVRVDE